MHVLGCMQPRLRFRRIKLRFEHKGLVRLRCFAPEILDGFGRVAEISHTHQVGISVVVYDGLIFIGSGHRIYAELSALSI